MTAARRTASWPERYGPEPSERMGFFTDTTLCIGCKACEVACKEWNHVPDDGFNWSGHSYDNTGTLSGSSWRHVAFIEEDRVLPMGGDAGTPPGDAAHGLRWLMSSDVCKHCTNAACLDVCPTGSLFRTEYGTVVVQDDICNGCGYCVPACPFGVIGKREIAGDPSDGLAQKCTLCYDRIGDGLEPACSKACPTDSIQFGPIGELRSRASARLQAVQARGDAGARLYGADPADGVGGFGAFFLLLDAPEVYGLPPDPVVTTRDLGAIWTAALAAAGVLGSLIGLAFVGGRR